VPQNTGRQQRRRRRQSPTLRTPLNGGSECDGAAAAALPVPQHNPRMAPRPQRQAGAREAECGAAESRQPPPPAAGPAAAANEHAGVALRVLARCRGQARRRSRWSIEDGYILVQHRRRSHYPPAAGAHTSRHPLPPPRQDRPRMRPSYPHQCLAAYFGAPPGRCSGGRPFGGLRVGPEKNTHTHQRR
jgi:hypothetical protein